MYRGASSEPIMIDKKPIGLCGVDACATGVQQNLFQRDSLPSTINTIHTRKDTRSAIGIIQRRDILEYRIQQSIADTLRRFLIQPTLSSSPPFKMLRSTPARSLLRSVNQTSRCRTQHFTTSPAKASIANIRKNPADTRSIATAAKPANAPSPYGLLFVTHMSIY